MAMKISVEGVELAVEQRGTGSPVLFIHGFPLDHTLWRHQLADLSSCRRIAPDLRGAGSSSVPDSPAEYSTTRYADDLAGVLDALDVERVVACGLSMGGYILFELLKRYPSRVRAAVFCNTKAEADTAEARTGRDDMATLALEQGASAVADKMLPKMLSEQTVRSRSEVVAEARAMLTRAPVKGIVGALRALRERSDHTATLAEITMPVLVVAGDGDQIIPAAGMRRMAARIRGARFELIAGAGHLAPLEQPAAVNRVLDAFLKGLG